MRNTRLQPPIYNHPIQVNMRGGRAVWITVCIEAPQGPIVQTHRLAASCAPPRPPDFLFEWAFYDSLAYRDAFFTRANWRAHSQVTHLPHDEPVFVSSCFSGLAIHDLRSTGDWRQCFYAAHADNDCEHVSFYKCLTERLGWKLMLAPRLWLQYQTGEQLHVKPRKRRRNFKSHAYGILTVLAVLGVMAGLSILFSSDSNRYDRQPLRQRPRPSPGLQR